MTDVDVNDSIEGSQLAAENALCELFACKHTSRSAQQCLQQLELNAGKIKRFAVYPNLARCGIEPEVTDNHGDCRSSRLSSPAQNRADSGKELAWVEWLGNVVVCSNLQAENSVDIFSARGQDQHRNRETARAASVERPDRLFLAT